ncbi:MAG: alkaline phosphatase family protein, partial [Pseudohongiella sp.]|nr:alkaline phosphatase family protein [Pseudohongiella sp.]
MITDLLRKPFSRRVFTRVLGTLIAGAAVLRLPVGAHAQAASQTLAQRASRNGPVSRIAFGSCVHQDKPQPIWDVVNTAKPDVFVFLGDNIYGDSE